MNGILVWWIRNPMLALAAVAVALPAAGIIVWGLGLSVAAVAAILASLSDHAAAGVRTRREEREEEEARIAAEAAGRARVTGFRDWLNEKAAEQQRRTDQAA